MLHCNMQSIYLVLTFCYTFFFYAIAGQWIVLSLFINGLSIDKPIFGKHHLKDKKIAARVNEINQLLYKNVSKNPSFSHKITLGIPLIC